MEVHSPMTLHSFMMLFEEIWKQIDEIFDSLKPDDWSRPHGPDWTIADVPYHLAYYDRDLVVRIIERSEDVPPEEQTHMRNRAELNAWNASKFAERPAGQTVEQSLEQMRASRDAIRRLFAVMSDADLERRVWFPLFLASGWRTARFVLESGLAHNWSEFMQLRLRLDRDEPTPDPALTHLTMNLSMRTFEPVLDREQAATQRFTAVMEFTGPGGGAWALRVADGVFMVTEEHPAQADLVITQSPITFFKQWIGMLNPAEAIQSEEIKVSDFAALGTFGALFPPPALDQVLEPIS